VLKPVEACACIVLLNQMLVLRESVCLRAYHIASHLAKEPQFVLCWGWTGIEVGWTLSMSFVLDVLQCCICTEAQKRFSDGWVQLQPSPVQVKQIIQCTLFLEMAGHLPAPRSRSVQDNCQSCAAR